MAKKKAAAKKAAPKKKAAKKSAASKPRKRRSTNEIETDEHGEPLQAWQRGESVATEPYEQGE